MSMCISKVWVGKDEERMHGVSRVVPAYNGRKVSWSADERGCT